MHSTLQKAGPSPYSLSVMAGVLLIAVTAYPQSLDTATFCKEKANSTSTQCAAHASKSMSGSLK